MAGESSAPSAAPLTFSRTEQGKLLASELSVVCGLLTPLLDGPVIEGAWNIHTLPARVQPPPAPLSAAAGPLARALETTPGMLPLRHDWQGRQHPRACAELASEHPHVGRSELLRLMQSVATRASEALLTAGGSLLGRTHAAPVNTTAQALTSKLRQRCTRPAQQLLRGTGRLPLSVVASFRHYVRCHGHKYATFCVLFDRTGRRMITGSDDYLIKIWCTKTGFLINTFKGHQEVITDLALNVENTLLASASADGTARIWNLKTGEPRAVLVANSVGRCKSITSVKFSPSPRPEIRYLATTCDDGLCRVYRWDRDRLIFDTTPTVIDGRSDTRDSISSFAFNHTGSRFAIATVAGYISVYSTIADSVAHWGAPKLIRRMAAHEENITTLVFSSDGEMLLSGSMDGTAKVWKCGAADTRWDSVSVDLKEPIPLPGNAPETLLHPQDGAMPPPMAVPPLSANSVATVAAAPAATGVEHRRGSLNVAGVREAPPVNRTLAHIAATAAAASGNDDGNMAVDSNEPPQDAAAASLVELVSDNTAALPLPTPVAVAAAPIVPAAIKRVEANQVAWICDNTRVIVSNNLGTVLVFDPRTGEVCWRRRAHSIVDVYVLIPHPTDPRIAVSGGYDGRAIVWDVETGDVLREIKVGEQLYDGAFSEDGQYFALASESGAATLYGLGSSWPYEDAQKMPEQMFASDYTATIMDANRFVADQHTQIPSYLVPHSALMDFDGRVYRRQKGSRFGLAINMGVDELVFAREDAGRRAALDFELDHAYLDHQAAQDPMAEVRPVRANRRRRQLQAQPTARGDAADEPLEAELPPMYLIPDDSDDEEYRAADDDDEEEEVEEDEEEDEDAVGGRRVEHAAPVGRITGRTRQDGDAGSTAYASDRDRRSALELLRTRHNRASARAQRSGNLRTARRGGSDSEASEFGDGSDPIDVDGDSGGESNARPNGDRSRGRLRRDVGASQPVNGPDTSDDEFQPSVARASPSIRNGGTRLRARGRGDAGGSRAPRVAEAGRQTRNRRIASDSEDEDEDGGDGRAEAESVDSDVNGEEGASSGSEFSDSGTRDVTPTRRRSGRANGSNAASRPTADGAGDETPQTRSLRARSGSYEHARRNLMEHPSGDFVSQMADASMEDIALAGARNRRVPRSNDNMPSSGDEYGEQDDDDGHITRRQSKRGQPPPAGSSSSAVATRRSAKTTASASTSHQAAMRATTNGGGLYQPTDWILATTPSTVPYRPQVGDIIAYFREGHEDFWKSPSRCKKLSDKLLPYVMVPSLAVAAFGKVVGMRYSVGPPTYCTVKIQLLKNQTIEELDMEGNDSHELTRRCIQVQYHDCDGVPDFLILYSRYRASLRRSLKCGDSVSVLFDEDQAHSAVITEFRDIKPTMRQSSVTRLLARNPWKSITVEWSGGSEVGAEQVSPWELVHDDDGAAAEIPADTKEALLDIVDTLRDVENFGWFVRNVDYVVDYPDYLLHIAYPMCLDTIYERLDNGFYRHPSAVAFDVGLIRDNADTFNDPGTLVPIAAHQLVSQYEQQASRVLGNCGLLEGSEHDHYGQEVSSPVARRSTRRSSAVPNGRHAMSPVAAAPVSARPSRKRKPQAAATRSGRCVSRRVDNDSEESDFADHYSEDNEHRGAGGVRRRLREKNHAFDEEEEESEDDGYSENDDDDDDLYT
ncbi:hypothetical protein GGH93_001526 [Coemansia aciculifera]|nr:hypothetical protein GGH93_001526 [Coemansia aciculifera]